jgi:hypothetical protein
MCGSVVGTVVDGCVVGSRGEERLSRSARRTFIDERGSTARIANPCQLVWVDAIRSTGFLLPLDAKASTWGSKMRIFRTSGAVTVMVMREDERNVMTVFADVVGPHAARVQASDFFALRHDRRASTGTMAENASAGGRRRRCCCCYRGGLGLSDY